MVLRVHIGYWKKNYVRIGIIIFYTINLMNRHHFVFLIIRRLFIEYVPWIPYMHHHLSIFPILHIIFPSILFPFFFLSLSLSLPKNKEEISNDFVTLFEWCKHFFIQFCFWTKFLQEDNKYYQKLEYLIYFIMSQNIINLLCIFLFLLHLFFFF